MTKLAILAKLEAKPGKENEVQALLEGALTLANEEQATPVWFAFKMSPTTFGIFDAFVDEKGRTAHLQGKIAAALMAPAPELLALPPQIDNLDLLAVKVTV